MTDEPTMLLLLLGCGVAVVFAVLLWKLLLLTGAIAAVQWAVVTGFADNPAVQAAALAVPALITAAVLRALPRLARSGGHPFTSRRRAHHTRWEALA